jgi:hypothetical protein
VRPKTRAHCQRNDALERTTDGGCDLAARLTVRRTDEIADGEASFPHDAVHEQVGKPTLSSAKNKWSRWVEQCCECAGSCDER